MTIQVTCACGKTLRARDELAGRKARCPGCGAVLQVPAPPPTSASPPSGIPGLAADQDDTASAYGPPSTVTALSAGGGADDSGPYDSIEEVAPALAKPAAPARSGQPQPNWKRTSLADNETLPTWKGPPKLTAPKKARSAGGSIWTGSGGGWFGNANAGVAAGIGMMVLAVVWFVVGLYAGWIFYYPPVLFVIGLISVIKGLLGG